MASSVFLLFMSKVIYYQKFKVGTNLFIDGASDKLILPVINRTQMCVTPIKEYISKTLNWYYGIRI